MENSIRSNNCVGVYAQRPRISKFTKEVFKQNSFVTEWLAMSCDLTPFENFSKIVKDKLGLIDTGNFRQLIEKFIISETNFIPAYDKSMPTSIGHKLRVT